MNFLFPVIEYTVCTFNLFIRIHYICENTSKRVFSPVLDRNKKEIQMQKQEINHIHPVPERLRKHAVLEERQFFHLGNMVR